MANTNTDNCDEPNKDILTLSIIQSPSNTIKVPNYKYTKKEDTKLKTDQHVNKVGVNTAIDGDNKVYLSDQYNLASGSNTLQVPVIKISGHSNLDLEHHLDNH